MQHLMDLVLDIAAADLAIEGVRLVFCAAGLQTKGLNFESGYPLVENGLNKP